MTLGGVVVKTSSRPMPATNCGKADAPAFKN
jgi:hypothetical protein